MENPQDISALEEDGLIEPPGMSPVPAPEEGTDRKNHQKEFLLLEKLHQLSQASHAAESIENLLLELRDPLLTIFNAEDITIFVVDVPKNEIFSKVKTDNLLAEIRIPISPKSLAGFVAQERKLINITDVQNPKELEEVHPDLEFDSSWDEKSTIESKSVLAVPLLFENSLMGVLELINKKDEGGFNATDENNAFLAAETLALALHNLKKLTPRRNKFSYLVDRGLLSFEDISLSFPIARETGINMEDLLMKDFNLSRAEVGVSLSDFYKLPYEGYDSSVPLPDPEVLGLDLETLKEQEWVPLKSDDSGTVILVNNPSNKKQLEKIEQYFPNQDVEFQLALKADLHDYLNSLFTIPDEPEVKAPPQQPEGAELELVMDENNIELTGDASDSAQTAFDEILMSVCEHEATDIHIEPGGGDRPILIRLRKEGVCRVLTEIPGSLQQGLTTHIKSLAELDPSKNKVSQHGPISWQKEAQKAELDAVIFPTIGDVEDIMIRVLSIGKPVPVLKSIDQLNLSEPNLEHVITATHKLKGLILSIGPTGSGKTTSLHAMLNNINKPDKKIVTTEDPVEIIQDGIRQIEVDLSFGLDINNSLRTFLLGTPDVILASDLPDAESFQLGMQAASKYLFLASMNCANFPQLLEHIERLEIDAEAFVESLSVIVVHKLVSTLCNNCKEDYHPTKEEYDALAKFYGEKYFNELGIEYTQELTVKQAGGCSQCLQTGYAGKTALHEVWTGTPKLNEMIVKKAPMKAIREQAISDGLISMNQDGIYKIFNGDCDFKKIKAAAIIEQA